MKPRPSIRSCQWWAVLLLITGTVMPCDATPVVTNVRAWQVSGTKNVDVFYDVSDPGVSSVRVSLQISSDNGANWTVPAQHLSGTGYGENVTPGNGCWIRWDAGADWDGQVSSQMRFRVTANDDPVPTGMASIPAGSFSMGDSFTEGLSDELPVHSVYVSAFYMQTTETTKAQWDDVRAWGLNNGYTDLPAGSVSGTTNYSKGANHPVFYVNWYDVVKWCNARSQKEGLTPCYTVSGTTYKTGSNTPDCNFSANGYRLPTEAEWEKAARGGASGHRFPWSDTDTITHSRANYLSSSDYSYDVSPTRGYHPTYNDGVEPYTSPVGSFAPNGYGLYDMAGNVWEWCNDWYDPSYYGSSPGSDPPGPSAGSDRVHRGSRWGYYADSCRVAARRLNPPDSSSYRDGFRCVRR